MNRKKITLRAEMNLCDEFPTKKFNFNKLCQELTKKGYEVESNILETMSSTELNDIILIQENKKEIKIFTCSDPYAKEAILDSNLSSRLSEVLEKIEFYLINNK